MPVCKRFEFVLDARVKVDFTNHGDWRRAGAFVVLGLCHFQKFIICIARDEYGTKWKEIFPSHLCSSAIQCPSYNTWLVFFFWHVYSVYM